MRQVGIHNINITASLPCSTNLDFFPSESLFYTERNKSIMFCSTSTLSPEICVKSGNTCDI